MFRCVYTASEFALFPKTQMKQGIFRHILLPVHHYYNITKQHKKVFPISFQNTPFC